MTVAEANSVVAEANKEASREDVVAEAPRCIPVVVVVVVGVVV